MVCVRMTTRVCALFLIVIYVVCQKLSFIRFLFPSSAEFNSILLSAGGYFVCIKMDDGDDIRLFRNAQRRLAYASMEAEKKAELLGKNGTLDAIVYSLMARVQVW